MSLRILLSPPDVGEAERRALLAAFDSGWIAPVGPDVDAFEAEMAAHLGGDIHAVALASGTAALHLALLQAGVGPGDEVLVPTLTFAATANAVRYTGAQPVFVDAEPDTWQLDPALAVEAIETRRPAAVVTVDLYGHCTDHDPIVAAAADAGIPVIEDAAEALGATHRGRPAGTLGDLGVLSFNGNKIITTSGGGMLLTRDPDAAARARHLATQAREPAPHYEHVEVGYNYRLSNLLAAVGRAQLARLKDKVARRREINARYRSHLADLPGVDLLTERDGDEATYWLTCLTIDPDVAGTDRETVRVALVTAGIEARPVWKPMHLQPAWTDAPAVGGQVAARLFDTGLCLPSGSNLTDAEVDEVAGVVAEALR
jgi:dTDP-4-amino-4,6-dideoxygalactose transaminase